MGKRIKHIPQRTCVGCRQVMPKKKLIRIVRTPSGIEIDKTGKLAGRGVYLHDNHKCWEIGLKGAIARSLKTNLSESDINKLQEFMKTLDSDTTEEVHPASS